MNNNKQRYQMGNPVIFATIILQMTFVAIVKGSLQEMLTVILLVQCQWMLVDEELVSQGYAGREQSRRIQVIRYQEREYCY